MPPPGRTLLQVSVNNGARELVPHSYIRLESVWVEQNTCLQLLDKLLREHEHAQLADKLSECIVTLKCRRAAHGNAPCGFKRPRSTEVIVATLFLADNLADTLTTTESDELYFYVTLPTPAAPAPVVDATRLLMRASTSCRLPARKAFKRMHGEHELFNSIVDYLESEGVGWGISDLPLGTEFVEHVTRCFWSLTPKVWQVLPRSVCFLFFLTRVSPFADMEGNP